MEEIRFLDLETHTAAENMAIDEAIMLSLKEMRVPPTLRIYRWHPSAVSIGVFQSLKEEIDVNFCRKNGIDIVRRITGGGAVYHDFEGEITYSIILPKGHRLVPDSILDSYKIICSGIVKALEHLGINAKFSPINDILVDGRKISGNAQTRRHACVLQHGTVLLDLDIETMFSVLKVSAEKISDKLIQDVKSRVTSIRDVLQRDVSFQELREALAFGFSHALDLELVPGALTGGEWKLAQELVASKYGNRTWNFKR